MPLFVSDGKDPLASSDGVTSRRNSGGFTTKRPRFNFIEGSNISISVVDDGGEDEVEVTISASSGVSLSNNIPVANNQATGTAGVGTLASRDDHRHPFDGTKFAYQTAGATSSLSFNPGFQPRILIANIRTSTTLYNLGFAFGTGQRQWHYDSGAIIDVGNIANTSGPNSYWAVTTFTSSNIAITRVSGAENWNDARVVVFGEP